MKATGKARAPPTKSHLSNTAESLGAPETTPVLCPGPLAKMPVAANSRGASSSQEGLMAPRFLDGPHAHTPFGSFPARYGPRTDQGKYRRTRSSRNTARNNPFCLFSTFSACSLVSLRANVAADGNGDGGFAWPRCSNPSSSGHISID